MSECRITKVGKRRDGGSRYWCLEHRADATAKYGRRSEVCRYAHIPSLTPDETLDLDIKQYRGGIALWGAVPPVYDTTSKTIDNGVHVHARRHDNETKDIDQTYRSVKVFSGQRTLLGEISELDAIYYMVTTVFGFKMKYVVCSLCGFPHLDKDWFSLHAHRRHLCAGCGKQFRDTEKGIGNPAVKIRKSFPTEHKIRSARRTKIIRQQDYPGGIQIWGSNPALIWTSLKHEESGIHLHAFREDGAEPAIDNTYSTLIVDGVKLDATMTRVLMAQNTLPHIEGRVVQIRCPRCQILHFEKGADAFSPHDKHSCHSCGAEFQSRGRLRKTIGNSMVAVLADLSDRAVRPPQQHRSTLLPETL